MISEALHSFILRTMENFENTLQRPINHAFFYFIGKLTRTSVPHSIYVLSLSFCFSGSLLRQKEAAPFIMVTPLHPLKQL